MADVIVPSFGAAYGDGDASEGAPPDAETALMDRAACLMHGIARESRTPYPIDCSPNSIDPNLAPVKPPKRKDLPAMSWSSPFDDLEEVESLVNDSWILAYGHLDLAAVAQAAKLPQEIARDLLSLSNREDWSLSAPERRAARRRLIPLCNQTGLNYN